MMSDECFAHRTSGAFERKKRRRIDVCTEGGRVDISGGAVTYLIWEIFV